MENFMVVNIAWNHSGWRFLEPNPKVNFGYASRSSTAAFSPHEALNFCFNKDGIDDKATVYGYFETYKQPVKFQNGGLIFFWSQSTDNRKNYLVGVYGNAEVISKLTWKFPGLENGEYWANLKGQRTLSCLFPTPLLETYFKTNKRRWIGRTNFTYKIDKDLALRILEGAVQSTTGSIKYFNTISILKGIMKYTRKEL